MRTAEIKRKTKETDISLKLTLEGGERKIDTGIGFFDHMLNSFAVHSGFGLTLTCKATSRWTVTIRSRTAALRSVRHWRSASVTRRVSRVSDSVVPMDEASVSARWISPAAVTSCSTHPCRSRCAVSTTPA